MSLQQDYLRQAHNLHINLFQSLCLRRRFHSHTKQLKLYYITLHYIALHYIILYYIILYYIVGCVWNVVAHAQKTDFVFRRNGGVYLNRRGRQFSRLLAGEVCASAVVMLDTSCSEVVWRVLATHSIRQFPLHFPSRASLCAITFQLESTKNVRLQNYLPHFHM